MRLHQGRWRVNWLKSGAAAYRVGWKAGNGTAGKLRAAYSSNKTRSRGEDKIDKSQNHFLFCIELSAGGQFACASHARPAAEAAGAVRHEVGRQRAAWREATSFARPAAEAAGAVRHEVGRQRAAWREATSG